ncbi:8-amino-7-oxononanoate synthase [Gammaproteobacteria bacterium]|nr:8-amino-7-oxononanoate synthase [Gammaproteobacteria bacterium]
MIESTLRDRLTQHKNQGLYRQLKPRSPERSHLIQHNNQTLINFASFDYLGLSQHPTIIQAYQQAIEQYGISATGAPTLNGYTQAHADLEQRLASYYQVPAVRLFMSGYQANLAVLSTFVTRDTPVFHARDSHASLIDGIRLSGAKHQRFASHDITALKALMSQANQPCWVVTESVFSMTGQRSNLTELMHLCNHQTTSLLVDDAHGIGWQPKGSLKPTNANIPNNLVITATFGKALGTAGAMVAGSQTAIDYLTQFARPYLFSTALPPAIAAATHASLNLLSEHPERANQLMEKIKYFQNVCQQAGIKIQATNTPIQPIIVSGTQQACTLSNSLAMQGFHVPAIRWPTVPKGQERLRISITYGHSNDHLEQLVKALSHALKSS